MRIDMSARMIEPNDSEAVDELHALRAKLVEQAERADTSEPEWAAKIRLTVAAIDRACECLLRKGLDPTQSELIAELEARVRALEGGGG